MPIYAGPYLASLKPGKEMCALLLTSPDCRCRVEYGATPDLGRVALCESEPIEGLRRPAHPERYRDIPDRNPAYEPEPSDNPPLPVTRHCARIDGLAPGERVYYRYVVDDVAGATHAFRAAPPPGEPFRFALISDLQMGEGCGDSARSACAEDIDFILYAGDCTYFGWQADQWFPLEGLPDCRRSFFSSLPILSQVPIFVCPGNHEMDDPRVMAEKARAADPDSWTWRIFTSLFRPLYPDRNVGIGARRWYSADYGDLHIVSLHVSRCSFWPPEEAPGWPAYDDISRISPQAMWLADDLRGAQAKYRWAMLHWHMLNRGYDTQTPYCQPVVTGGAAAYPRDDCWEVLRPLFERCGVNGVNFGHSHVYERYRVHGVHYIEAAHFGRNYRDEDAPPHPSGYLPAVEENRFHSYLIVDCSRDGLRAHAVQADVPPGAEGFVGRVFDEFALS